MKSKIHQRSKFIQSEDRYVKNFYDRDSLNDFVENDIISPEEEGFMMGYLKE